MDEPNIWFIIPGFLAGLAIGALYFGGLWLTVRDLSRRARPALWLLASFALRTAVVLGGFYLLLRVNWVLVAAAMVGFLAIRTVLTRKLGHIGAKHEPAQP